MERGCRQLIKIDTTGNLFSQTHYAHPNTQHAPDYNKSLPIDNRSEGCESTYRLYHKWKATPDYLPQVDTESMSQD